MNDSPITYTAGTGKSDKAYYSLGRARVPAAVVTRILKAAEKLDDRKKDRLFLKSMAKYDQFVDGCDLLGIDYSEALRQMEVLRPAPKVKQPRSPKADKVASTRNTKQAKALALLLCNGFKDGEFSEVLEKFKALLDTPGFQDAVSAHIDTLRNTNGVNPLGFVRVREAMTPERAVAARVRLAGIRARAKKSAPPAKK